MLLVVVSDPVGIRTRDPQLRRLLLYPAELPDPAFCNALYAFARQNTRVGTIIQTHKGNLGAKVLLFFDLCKSKTKKLQKFLKKFL